jgi:hypothetical protein
VATAPTADAGSSSQRQKLGGITAGAGRAGGGQRSNKLTQLGTQLDAVQFRDGVGAWCGDGMGRLDVALMAWARGRGVSSAPPALVRLRRSSARRRAALLRARAGLLHLRRRGR